MSRVTRRRRIIQTDLARSEKFPLVENFPPKDHPTEDIAKADARVQFQGLQCFPQWRTTREIPACPCLHSEAVRCKKILVGGTIHDPWETEKDM